MKNKRELILKSVLELLMEDGVNGLKVSNIAAKADIGKGTVYEYFSSKEDLFIGAVGYGIEQLIKTIHEKLEETFSFRESFDSLVESIAGVAARGPFMSFMSDSSSMPFSKDTVMKMELVMRDAMISFMKILSGILKQGVEEGLIKPPASPEYTKAMLIIISNMTMQHIHCGKGDLEALKNFYYDACLKLFA